MSPTRSPRIRLLIGMLTIALVAVPAAAASASHNRAVSGAFSVTGNEATWDLKTAWRVDRIGHMVSDTPGDTITISELGAASDAPGTGTPTAVTLTLETYTTDRSNPLFSLATENFTGDLSTLGDGLYEVYAKRCCRVYSVANAGDNFSQWVRFTKTGSAYDVSPVFTAAPLYHVLPTAGTLVLDYAATDPEGGAVGYALVTDINSPYFGAPALACSTFVESILTIGPALCTGSDVYADIYTAGTSWVVAVTATDAAGNQTSTDSMLRMPTVPEPHIASHAVIGNGTSLDFSVYAFDPGDSWVVDCVGVTNATDIVTATGTTSPIRMTAMTVGENYTCEVTATNSVGTGTSVDGYLTGPIVLDGVLLQIHLAVGDTLSGTMVDLTGANLTLASDWTLVQDSMPLTLASGTADDGTFLETLALPASACVPGVHTLLLTGVGSDSTPRTDQVWYELGVNCDVLQFSRTGAVTAPVPPAPPEAPAALPVLAATGAPDGLAAAGGALTALMLGVFLTLAARSRRAGRVL